MTANIKATLATAGVACFIVLIFVRPDIALVMGMVLMIDLILAVTWFMFKDAFDD